MEVKGTQHLRDALFQMYRCSAHRTFTGAITDKTNFYHHNLCTIRIAGRTIIPLAWDYMKLGTEIARESSPIEGPISDKLVFPLVPYGGPFVKKRTADPLIGYLLKDVVVRGSTIKAVETSTGEKYYGGSGFILDKEYTPLVIFGAEFIFTEYKGTMESPVCIINPIVFQREDIVSKYIVKKLIPCISDYNVGSVSVSWQNDKMKLMITPDISKFVEKPARPTAWMDKKLWDCARENLNEILDLWN